jgi:hypothetical protein
VTTPHLAGHPAASQQAIVDAALLMLRQMGLSPDELLTAPRDRPPVPTFAEYVPVVSAAVTAGTRRAYGSYWNRVIGHWGERRLDEIAPSEIRQLMSYVKTHVVARRNARGGRSATEHLVAALRCLYKHAEDDGYITPGENPARKVDKPRRLPSTRRAVTDDRLAEICQAAADGGDDPELDTLLLRLHTGTACRRGGAPAAVPQPPPGDAQQACPGGQVQEDDDVGGLQPDRQGGGVVAVDDPPRCGHQVPLQGRELRGIQRSPVRLVVQAVQVHRRDAEYPAERTGQAGLAAAATADHSDPVHGSRR